LVRQLQQLGTDMVASFGRCANNAAWPEGWEKDKHHVSQMHKFCIAMENNLGDDYVTEKVWDCLRAGAVPVYYGAKNAAR
jgi:alpha-1,4-fucosyltransferase